MPEVCFYKPNGDINWIVRNFETIKSNYISQTLTDNFIPRPDVALVFNFGNLPQALSPTNFQLSALFIAKISVNPIQLHVEGKLDSFIVICNASVLSRVLNLNFADKESSIIDLSNKELFQLWKQLFKLTSTQDRIKYFSNFILKLVKSDYQFDQIDRIYFNILDNCLKKPLKEITTKSFYSVSSLQRNFSKRTGTSMKKLIRIARIHAIFNKMLAIDCFDFSQLILDSNYYDQSHFIKDFKEITGLSPKRFFTLNSDLCRAISGMQKNPSCESF